MTYIDRGTDLKNLFILLKPEIFFLEDVNIKLHMIYNKCILFKQLRWPAIQRDFYRIQIILKNFWNFGNWLVELLEAVSWLMYK